MFLCFREMELSGKRNLFLHFRKWRPRNGNGTLHYQARARKIKKIHPEKKFLILQEMELSSSNIKKFLYFLKRKLFSYTCGNRTLHFSAQARNITEIHPEKISYTSVNENPEKFFIFSPQKAFLIFRKMETPKKFFIFQETEVSYISENGKRKNFLYFKK